MRAVKIVFGFCLLGLVLATGSVDPAYRYTSARGIGVGNAYSALVDDYSAVFVNPAAIGKYDKAQVGLMQTNLFSDVNLLNGAVIFPSETISYGLGFYYIGTSIPQSIWDRDRYIYTNMLGYNDITALGSVASKINEQWSLGLTGKYRFANADGYNVSVFNADIGTIYEVNQALRLSAVYHNALPLKVKVQGGGEDELQQKLTLGSAYKFIGQEPGTFLYSKNQDLDFSFDVGIVDQQTAFSLGAEYKPVPYFAVRAGYGNEKWAASTVSVEAKNLFSLGLGVNFDGIKFDYAYSIDPNDFSVNNTHYFSVAFDLFKPEAVYTDEYMQISSPEDKVVTYQNMHKVVGTVIPKVAKVQINGTDVEIKNSRILAAIKYGDYGKQVINIAVFDKDNKVLQKLKIRNVYLMSFYDVDKHNWARQYIEELTTLGLLRPATKETYNSEGNVSRAEYAKVLYALKNLNMKDIDLTSGYRFADIASHPYSDYIQLVAQSGMMIGTSPTEFSPNENLTREQLVAALVILEGLPVPEKALKSRFKDVSVSRWSTKYIEVAVDSGLINGYNDGTFQPKRAITRAEFSKVVHNTTMGQRLVKDLFDWDSF
ncbi:MAG: PorV/PorQ family protein [Candidatus Margulisbacteria bacterium]|nr:PorV/PorQ family protein [Candidatus Margulisiibacteriota bacterium]